MTIASHLPAADSPQRRSVSDELCEVVRQIHAQGWCQGTGGNFSVCLGREPLRLLITQSGRDKRRIGPDDLVLVDGKGRAVDGEQGKPSGETRLHCTIAAKTGASSVLHTHSVAATLLGEHFLDAGGLAITGYEMLKGLTGIETHEASVRVPVLANDQNMPRFGRRVDELLDAQPGLHGFLIGGHGLYTWGATVAEAQRHVEIFEFLFECVARRVRFAPFTG